MAEARRERRAQQGGGSFLKRGDAAKDTLKQQAEEAEARRLAAENRGLRRFYVRKNETGRGFQEHEVIVLDDDATQAPHAFVHHIPGPGLDWAKTRDHTCVDEFQNCVLCRAQEQGLGEEFGRAHYGAYITVLDLTPYKIQRGARAGETVEYSRKLIEIPQKSIPTFMKIFELAKREHGTTRGIVMVLTKNDKQDARCGVPQMLDNGRLFDFEPEEVIEGYANDAVIRDGKVVKEEGADIEPADYDKELAPEDSAVLRQLYRLPAATGSEEEQAEETGSSRMGRRRRGAAQEPEQPQTGSRRRSRVAGAAGEEADTPAPETTGRRRRAGAAPAQTQHDDGADGDDGYEDEPGGTVESPPPRTRAARNAARQQEAAPEPAPQPRRRQRLDQPDPAPAQTATGGRRRRAVGDDEIPF